MPAAQPPASEPDWGKRPPRNGEREFLEGPQDRGSEFLRTLRIGWEFMRGFRKLHFVGPCVTIFGSARFPESHPYYRLAREVGAAVSYEGFTVMTGGGPGIMEAANRGARDASGPSVGCNIELPQEQHPNPYLDTFVEFRYFFVRKVMLAKYSYAFIAMPGGLGTLDEMFEILTLIQTRKIRPYPVVLMGADYWQPLMTFLRERPLAMATIDAADLDHLFVTDSPAEAAAYIRQGTIEQFGLRRVKQLRKRRFLFE